MRSATVAPAVSILVFSGTVTQTRDALTVFVADLIGTFRLDAKVARLVRDDDLVAGGSRVDGATLGDGFGYVLAVGPGRHLARLLAPERADTSLGLRSGPSRCLVSTMICGVEGHVPLSVGLT